VVTDFLRVDKRFFGLTGSQWTALTVAVVCALTLLAWAFRARGRTERAEATPTDPAEGEARAAAEAAPSEPREGATDEASG